MFVLFEILSFLYVPSVALFFETFIFMHVCHIYVGPHRDQKKISSHPPWVLGPKLRSSRRVVWVESSLQSGRLILKRLPMSVNSDQDLSTHWRVLSQMGQGGSGIVLN